VALSLALLLEGITILSGFWIVDHVMIAVQDSVWWQMLHNQQFLQWLMALQGWAIPVLLGAHSAFWVLVRLIWKTSVRRLATQEGIGI
jgi:hypothetical protein